MKKSVNGKTFDEIFEQRGKEVQASEMVKDGIYLNTCIDYDDCEIIFKFDKNEDNTIYSTIKLFNNGKFGNINTKCGLLYVDEDEKFFKATPDQIELLNAYKNE